MSLCTPEYLRELARQPFGNVAGQRDGLKDAADEIERLQKIEAAASALRFSAYPAHGSGFVMQVSGGNINDLKSALGHEGTEMITPKLSG